MEGKRYHQISELRYEDYTAEGQRHNIQRPFLLLLLNFGGKDGFKMLFSMGDIFF